MTRVDGPAQLAGVARRLRAHSGAALQRDMARGLRESNRGTIAAFHRSALDTLPSGGGLAGLVARQPVTARIDTGGGRASVRFAAQSRMDLAEINRGRLAHPVYGNRQVWVSQTVPPGWWDKPAEQETPRIRAGLDRVLSEVSRQIERG